MLKITKKIHNTSLKYYDSYEEFMKETVSNMVEYLVYEPSSEEKYVDTNKYYTTFPLIEEITEYDLYRFDRDNDTRLIFEVLPLEDDKKDRSYWDRSCFSEILNYGQSTRHSDSFSIKDEHLLFMALLYLPEKQKKYLLDKIKYYSGKDVEVYCSFVNNDVKNLIISYFSDSEKWQERLDYILSRDISILDL